MNELEKNKHNTHIFSLLIYIIFHLLDNEKIQFSNSDLKKQIHKNKSVKHIKYMQITIFTNHMVYWLTLILGIS